MKCRNLNRAALYFLTIAAVTVFCWPVAAQTLATTEDGRQVILNPDGTWKYAATPTPASPAAAPSNAPPLTDDINDDLQAAISGIINPPRRVTGKVVGVHDGDTLTLLDESKTQYKVRFNGIDAPELKQDFGNRSKENLSALVFGKVATISCPKIDKYERWVCTVFLDGKDLNLEQVKGGFAWHYKKYANEQSETDRTNYAAAETAARAARLGLWGQPNPTEPGAWRRGVNNPNMAGVPPGAIVGNTNSLVYHTPGCSSYAKVSPQNRITFANEKEALAKGYRLAGGCESTLPPESRPKRNAEETKRVYQKGPRGGCYYLNAAGKKVYADKELCN